MNILIPHREVGHFFGGAENHLKEVAKKLSLKGHHIMILTEKGILDPLKDLKKLKNVEIIYLPSLKLRRSTQIKKISTGISKGINKKKSLTKYLRILNNLPWITKSGFWIFFHKKKFDLIWSSKNIDTISLKILNKITKIPYVVSLEGYDFIEAENSKNCSYVFTISPFIKKECEKKHKFSPELITIGIDFEKFQKRDLKKIKMIKKRFKSPLNKLILNVARLVESKDISTFIKAASLVLKKNPNTIFLVCGTGEEKEKLKRLIKQKKIEKRFFLLDVFGEELIPYYQSSDIFVHVPKFGNHFGVAYIEAMAAGLPLVASNKEATPDTVSDAAILVEPEREIELEKAIEKLIRNNKLRKKLSENSNKRVKEVFNWEKIIPNLESFFKKALTNQN